MSGTQEGMAKALIKLLQMSAFPTPPRDSYSPSMTKALEFWVQALLIFSNNSSWLDLLYMFSIFLCSLCLGRNCEFSNGAKVDIH